MDAVSRELEILKGALQEADKVLSRKTPGPSELRQAGQQMCKALGAVVDEEPGADAASHGLLSMLRSQLADDQLYRMAWPLRQQDMAKLRRLLRDPVVSAALSKLGYQPPPRRSKS